RFMSAPLGMSFAAARQHVEARSEDLAQTRPELGHATNALCPVGRRERTRGLFLDRRAFLTTYDPTQDDAEGTVLTRILQAAVPAFRDGAFHPYQPEAEQLPRAASSVDWYRGWRDHLEFAEVGGQAKNQK